MKKLPDPQDARKKTRLRQLVLGQKGWGLTETLLTLGALTVMSVAIYAVFKPSDATAQIRIEQDNLHVLSRNVDRSFGLLGTFEDVTTERVVNDELAPSRMLISGNEIRTQWGTVATVAPYEDPAKGVMPNTAFSVTYPGTSEEVCAGLASAMARDAFDILVDGRSVYDINGMDPAVTAERCAGGNSTMEFVFHSGLVAGQAVAAPQLDLPPAPPSTSTPPPAPPVVTTPTNPGVDDATPGVIPTPGGGGVVAPPPLPPVAPPPTPTPPAPTPPPVPVAPPGEICVPLPDRTETQTRTTVSCPEGAYGTRDQQRSRLVTSACPEAWASPEEDSVPWGEIPWTVVSNNCTACPSPQTDTETRTREREQNCPAGQTGKIFQERPEQRTRTRTASCPANSPAPTWSSWSSWSSWQGAGSWTTVSNTCEESMPSNCNWRLKAASYAPNFGNLDGEMVVYSDGLGGGCTGSWGGRYGDVGDFDECKDSIPNRPPSRGATYSESEFTNYGGGMENYFEYDVYCPSYVVLGTHDCGQDSLCAPPSPVWPSSWRGRAEDACAGAPAGSNPGTIDYCHQSYILCSVYVECTGE